MYLRTASVLFLLLAGAAAKVQAQLPAEASRTSQAGCEMADSSRDHAVSPRSCPSTARPTVNTIVLDPSRLQTSRTVGLSELLEGRVPGLYSLDVGARNDLYRTIRLRGPNGFAACPTCAPKVLIDGVEINQVALGTLDVQQIARVEVVRGPHASLRLGPDASAGVIQLFTRKTAATEGTSAEAGAIVGTSSSPYLQESSGLGALHGAVAGRFGTTGYALGISHTSSQGHVPEFDSGGTTASFGFSAQYADVGVSGFTRVAERRFTTPGWAVAYYELYADGVLPAWGDHIDDNDRGEYRSLTLGINVDYQPREWWRTSLTVGNDQVEIDLSTLPTFAPRDSMVGADTDRQSLPSVRLNSTVDVTVTRDLDASFTAGLDARRRRRLAHQSYHRFSESPTVLHWRGQIIDSEYTGFGGFGEAQFRYRDGVALSLGMRADQHSFFGDAYGDWALSPRAALSYEALLSGGWAVRPHLAWAVGLAMPSQEMLTGAGDLAGNPEIGPQRTDGWEMGVAVDGLEGRLGAEATAFYETSTDLLGRIARDPGDIRTRYRNDPGTIRNSGVELAVWWLGTSAEVRANLSTSSNAFREATALGAIERVREEPAPEMLAWGEAKYSLPGWFGQNGAYVGGRAQHIGRLWAFDPRAYFTAQKAEQVLRQDHRWFESFTRGDLFAGVSVTRHADAAVELLNVTDNITPESPEIVLPGRQLRFSLRARL